MKDINRYMENVDKHFSDTTDNDNNLKIAWWILNEYHKELYNINLLHKGIITRLEKYLMTHWGTLYHPHKQYLQLDNNTISVIEYPKNIKQRLANVLAN